MAKKKDVTVDVAAEETKAPTKSLFGGGAPTAAEAETSEDASETAEDATEATEEAVAEATDTMEEPAADETAEASSDEDDVSVEELRRQAEEINRRLAEKTNAEKNGILAQVVQVVGEYGITTEEVVAALGGLKMKRKGTPAKMKYRDPATGAEWSGRGKEPLWIRDKDRAQFAIPEEVAAAA